MRFRYILSTLGVLYALATCAQKSDSIKSVYLPEVMVSESYQQLQKKKSALTVEVANKEFMRKYFNGNFVQSMANIPGVQSMDIGAGFSKPMIRGMAFNRIAVLENGVKQEGQQWGSDHGLELDAFSIETARVLKGPSSLLYGSDAMGGVIDIVQPFVPQNNQIFGEAMLLGKSVNGTLGGSLMLGVKKNAWYAKLRYSEQHFGDYRVPTDTVIYLTQRIPIYNRKLKNTAGFERNIGLFAQYQNRAYKANYAISNVYQKTGFFPGAHGIPDLKRVQDDGDSRNIDLPYSFVNHLKLTTHQQYVFDRLLLSGDFGFQNNHREEWSVFHTHYGTQPLPNKDPDKELEFNLNTYSASVRTRISGSSSWEHTLGWDGQYQQNKIGGYSFLLPQYMRLTTGVLWLSTFRPTNSLTVTGGVRYDYGKIHISSHNDPYLATYLQNQGYSSEDIETYRWNSHEVRRNLGDYSFSLGFVWNSVPEKQLLKMNIGRSFRLPGANELASNGVHHGTFRHEQGDATLNSEQGWQLDASYSIKWKRISLSLSPFVNWFSNYIFIRPTGEWSVLPHAGQIYRYSQTEALFAGGEASIDVQIHPSLSYQLSGEYVYTYNCRENIPLSFSPPASMRNTLTWQTKKYSLSAEWQTIAAQHRVDRNEDYTGGANLFHLSSSFNVPLGNKNIEITLSARNIFDKRYYNHLSFYRKVAIPEPGRSFQFLIKIPFNKLLK